MSIFDKNKAKVEKPTAKKKEKQTDRKKADLGFVSREDDHWTKEELQWQKEYLKDFGWNRIR